VGIQKQERDEAVDALDTDLKTIRTAEHTHHSSGAGSRFGRWNYSRISCRSFNQTCRP
jgi:hypothetical protein